MKYLDLLSTATDCVLYGLLLTAVTMLILYFLLQAVSKTCVKTIPFYLAGIVLAPLLVVQNTLLVACFQALGMVEAVEIDIQHIVGTYNQAAMGMQETQTVLQQVGQDFPLIGWFANLTNLEVDNAQNLAFEMTSLLKDYLTTYLWKRIGWCAAFIVMAVLIALLADKRNKDAALAAPSGRGRRQSATSAIRRGDRHTSRSGRRHRF